MRHAAFALRDSGLEPFLFAEVGTELNGAALTVLSTLARLDCDPWAEAASLAALPATSGIERLAACIERMPLAPAALAEARATAARLVSLLPAAAPPVRGAKVGIAAVPALPGWRPLALFALFLALGIAVNLIHMPAPATPPSVPVAHVGVHNGLT